MIHKTRTSRSEKARRWSERLERLERRPGTVDAFCEAEGVSRSSVGYWTRKGGESARARGAPAAVFPTRSAFVPVEVVPERILGGAAGLPDPRWAAEFVLHLCGSGR